MFSAIEVVNIAISPFPTLALDVLNYRGDLSELLGCLYQPIGEFLDGTYFDIPHITPSLCANLCTQSAYFGLESGIQLGKYGSWQTVNLC